MAGTDPAMTIAFRWEPETLDRTRPIEPLTHFLARLEKRHRLLIDSNMGAGARVPACSGRPVLYREGAEAAEFDSIALCHCAGDLAKDCVDDVLNVALIEMRVLARNALDKF